MGIFGRRSGFWGVDVDEEVDSSAVVVDSSIEIELLGLVG